MLPCQAVPVVKSRTSRSQATRPRHRIPPVSADDPPKPPRSVFRRLGSALELCWDSQQTGPTTRMGWVGTPLDWQTEMRRRSMQRAAAAWQAGQGAPTSKVECGAWMQALEPRSGPESTEIPDSGLRWCRAVRPARSTTYIPRGGFSGRPRVASPFVHLQTWPDAESRGLEPRNGAR